MSGSPEQRQRARDLAARLGEPAPRWAAMTLPEAASTRQEDEMNMPTQFSEPWAAGPDDTSPRRSHSPEPSRGRIDLTVEVTTCLICGGHIRRVRLAPPRRSGWRHIGRSMRTTWQRDGKSWVSAEQRDGTPDWRVERLHAGPGGVSLKLRTSQKGWRFDSIADAKRYAEQA